MSSESVTVAAPEDARLGRVVAHLRSPLHRNGYALVLATFGQAATGALFWAIAARRYSPATVGLNTSLISSMMFLTNLSSLNFTDVLNRFVPVGGRATKRLVLISYGIAVGLGVVSATIFLIGLRLWTPYLHPLLNGPGLVALYFVSVLLWIVFVLEDAVLIGLRRALYVFFENTGWGVVKIVLLVALAAAFPRTGIFLAWTLPLVLFVVVVNLIVFRRLLPAHAERTRAFEEPITRSIIGRFVVADYVASLLWTAAIALTPLIALATNGASASAYVYIAWTIAYTLFLVNRNMGMSLTTEGAQEPERLYEHTRATVRASARIVIPLAALLIVAAHPFLYYVFKPVYAAHATGLLRLFALAMIPALVPTTFVAVARIQKRLVAMVVVTAVSTVPVLALAPVLMHFLGVIGMGWAWLIVQCVVAVVVYFGELRPHWRSTSIAVR
jgi:O-antigen/teichoic acid export membrane protein